MATRIVNKKNYGRGFPATNAVRSTTTNSGVSPGSIVPMQEFDETPINLMTSSGILTYDRDTDTFSGSAGNWPSGGKTANGNYAFARDGEIIVLNDSGTQTDSVDFKITGAWGGNLVSVSGTRAYIAQYSSSSWKSGPGEQIVYFAYARINSFGTISSTGTGSFDEGDYWLRFGAGDTNPVGTSEPVVRGGLSTGGAIIVTSMYVYEVNVGPGHDGSTISPKSSFQKQEFRPLRFFDQVTGGVPDYDDTYFIVYTSTLIYKITEFFSSPGRFGDYHVTDTIPKSLRGAVGANPNLVPYPNYGGIIARPNVDTNGAFIEIWSDISDYRKSFPLETQFTGQSAAVGTGLIILCDSTVGIKALDFLSYVWNAAPDIWENTDINWEDYS